MKQRMAPAASDTDFHTHLDRQIAAFRSELESLFQTETASRVCAESERLVSEIRAQLRREFTENLNASVRRLRQCRSVVETAQVLADSSRPFADHAAVFAIEDVVRGAEWDRADEPARARFRNLKIPKDQVPALAGAMESGDPVVTMASAAEVSEELMQLFEHRPEERVHLVPVLAGKETVAVVYGWGSVDPAGLELLAQLAGAALSSLKPAAPAPAAGLVTITGAGESNKQPATRWDDLAPEDRSLHVQAQRFASVTTARMLLYRADAVKQGRQDHDLYGALRDAIDAARRTFRERFMGSSRTMVDYLHVELLRNLAKDDAPMLGPEYPGPLV
jgi:hypothetical protein